MWCGLVLCSVVQYCVVFYFIFWRDLVLCGVALFVLVVYYSVMWFCVLWGCSVVVMSLFDSNVQKHSNIASLVQPFVSFAARSGQPSSKRSKKQH